MNYFCFLAEFQSRSSLSCDLCYQHFSTEYELNQHIEVHLNRQLCTCCNKTVIVIGGQLYELHVPHTRGNEISEVKRETVEALGVYLNNQQETDIDLKAEDDIQENAIENSEWVSEAQAKRFRPRKHVKYNNLDYSDSEGDSKVKRKRKPKTNKVDVSLEGDDKIAVASSNKQSSEDIVSDIETKPYNCSTCDRKFKSKRGLTQHDERLHSEKQSKEKPSLECDICGRLLKTAQYLREHKRTHSTEKLFICNHCGKGFNVKFHLKEHIYMHTGERPYKCDFCEKTFNRTTLKYSHQRMHTGEKPFKCDVVSCDKAYSFSVDLKRHRRAQHQIFINCKRFECPVCQKIFYENKFLRQHMTTHRLKD